MGAVAQSSSAARAAHERRLVICALPTHFVHVLTRRLKHSSPDTSTRAAIAPIHGLAPKCSLRDAPRKAHPTLESSPLKYRFEPEPIYSAALGKARSNSQRAG